MKPCAKNRKLISWLALDALDARQSEGLRAHLETCEGCRNYQQEVLNAIARVTAPEIRPDIQASESFHQRIVAALRPQESGSVWESLAAHFRGIASYWRVALPLIGAAAAVIAIAFVFLGRSGAPAHMLSRTQTVSAPTYRSDLPPTIANYQMVANQSLEELDELLTRQGTRNLPPTRAYTAASALD
jgi:anti-sigma factor RsiW